MRAIRLTVGALALAMVTPVVAQSTQDPAAASTPLPYDRGYDKDDARTRAINDSGRPAVQAANESIAAQAAARDTATGIDQARYAEDVAAYRAALDARHETMAAEAAMQADRERAYAMAMADWRAQVAACERGRTRACRLPTPNPADYM